jgi:signal peptidase II
MLKRGLVVAALVALADQLSKAWVLSFFAEPGSGLHSHPVTGFFNLVLTWNRGVSFGLFNNDDAMNALVFTGAAAIIVAGLVLWLHRTREPLLGFAIGLVIGGAIGNVIDRIARGAVVDFLDFHLAGWHFFAFNLADSAITIGVFFMVIDGLRARREAPN